MKLKIVVCAVILAALVGFGLGWKVGRPRTATMPAANASAGGISALANARPKLEEDVAATVVSNQFLTLPEVEQALRELDGLTGAKRWQRLQAIAGRIDSADIQAVVAKLAASPAGSQSVLRGNLLERWGAFDPHTAMDFANAIKDANGRRSAVIQVLRGWMELDLTAAVAWTKQLRSGPLQFEALGVVGSALAAKDPESAVEMLEPLDGRGVVPYTVRDVFEQWSTRDPVAAAARALELKNWWRRQAVYSTIARNWAAQDLSAALAWAQTLPDRRDRASVVGSMMGSWAAKDPQAAAEYALSSEESRGMLLSQVAMGWAQKDLNATVAWMKQLPTEDQTRVLQDIKLKWTQADPQAAAAYGLSLTAGSTQNNFLNQVARAWAGTDPKAAVAWLAQVPEGDGRFSAINGIAAGWAQTAPQDAANFVASLPPGATQEAAARNVLFEWRSADPAAAATWLAQFPEGELRTDVMQRLVKDWADNDAAAAGKFLEGLPAGQSREAAVNAYIAGLAMQSPESAAPFVSQIADEDQRFSSAQTLARSYLRSDPAGYAKWLTTLQLPEEKLKLLPK